MHKRVSATTHADPYRHLMEAELAPIAIYADDLFD
jgi:hypothetical protein